jgi:hypothetical protein
VLWKQLDFTSGESNWLDIAAVTSPELQTRANELLDQMIELHATPELLSTAKHDRNRLLETIESPSGPEQLEELKSYLRDRALDRDSMVKLLGARTVRLTETQMGPQVDIGSKVLDLRLGGIPSLHRLIDDPVDLDRVG